MGAIEVTGGPIAVFTNGSTTVSTVTPVTRPVDGRRAEKCRPHLRIEDDSGDVKARVVYQTSDDGVAWSSAKTMSGYTTYVTSTGWTYGSSLATLSEASYVRLCIEALNQSGTTKAAARLSVAADFTYNS